MPIHLLIENQKYDNGDCCYVSGCGLMSFSCHSLNKIQLLSLVSAKHETNLCVIIAVVFLFGTVYYIPKLIDCCVIWEWKHAPN